MTLQRVPQPDCPHSSRQWQIQYGSVNRPGTVAWFPDVPRCWPLVHEVAQWVREDKDCLGREFRNRAVGPCKPRGADEPGPTADGGPEVVATPGKPDIASAKEVQADLFAA